MTFAHSIRPLLRTLITGMVGAGAFAGLVAPATAEHRAPCIPGTQRPICTIWSGKVTFVADGDTVEAAGRRGVTTRSDPADGDPGDGAEAATAPTLVSAEGNATRSRRPRGSPISSQPGIAGFGSPRRIRTAGPALGSGGRSARRSTGAWSTSRRRSSPRAMLCGCPTPSSTRGTVAIESSRSRRRPIASTSGTATPAGRARVTRTSCGCGSSGMPTARMGRTSTASG